ncbi:MAG: alanine--tRNA ligase [Candidatus Woesearchaeota archaeon]
MLSDKQVKKKFKVEASNNPEKYYPVTYLKKEGFIRRKCQSCDTNFWTVNEQQFHCGDPTCSGGFNVIKNNPSKIQLTYIQVWKKIIEMLEPKEYKPINRYPVVARWNPTADFVMASIAAFQPYVVSGEVNPPAKKLIIPQFSLRFGDVDNVGITGSHLTGFVMIGQHAFVDETEWNQEQLFKDIYEFLTIGIGLPKNEMTIHEDAWAGGGSFGPCMEFFSRGVELFNQVYTMFEQTPEGDKPLKLKVLDMGLGMERIAWFSQGTPNIYEATFPKVLTKLREITNVKMDYDLYKKFSAYSAFLNVDEVDNIEEAWSDVAKKLDLSVEQLRENILPMTALYSIAEHSRTLLVALTDGALPSNVGGGYNLRVIYRRAQGFIDQFGWKLDIAEITEWHADELKELFPELSNNLEDVKNIINVEKQKYFASKEKAKSIVAKIIQKDITTKTLLELYDSNGINPEVIKEEAKKLGKNISIPDNFYVMVSELHEQQEQIHATRKELDIDIPLNEKTEALYFDDFNYLEFQATVKYLRKKDEENIYVILDKTAFYPTSGGQINDLGKINSFDVVDVIKIGNVIVHVVPNNDFKEGDVVNCIIDKERRQQLTKHHTATHIINAAAKKVLGNHINQIGAKKTLDKATLDVTHYESLSDEQIREIENEANKIVNSKIKVHKFFLTRDKAEQKYGLNIYQGGAIPGNNLRMVIIGDIESKNNLIDVECCAGTHLDNTEQVGNIKILKSSKISDGVVRLTYVAGDKANKQDKDQEKILNDIAKLLSCDVSQIPSRALELFSKWKKYNKAMKKGKDIDPDLTKLTSIEIFKGTTSEILQETSKILNTQSEHVLKTITKFLNDINNGNKKNPSK